MAKKAKTVAPKFDVEPAACLSIIIDVDFCGELGAYIAKHGGSEDIVEFGKCLLRTAIKYNKAAKSPIKAKKTAKVAEAEKVKRDKLIKKAKELHAKGQSFRVIGKKLGVSAITVGRYCKK